MQKYNWTFIILLLLPEMSLNIIPAIFSLEYKLAKELNWHRRRLPDETPVPNDPHLHWELRPIL